MVSVKKEVQILMRKKNINSTEIAEIYRECRKHLAEQDTEDIDNKSQRLQRWLDCQEDTKEDQDEVWKLVLEFLQKI